ncbi:uncharacterized protein LOC128300243 [Anopheles moucheti]|uniref:uncharacterized protein LOC128300243 n=1 Tax=Anopheles moucheti TaxID=186751 RepID=UPI0022F0CC7E|nr:uncharacterized protein LOC128300243 [Anopheles moucheti]
MATEPRDNTHVGLFRNFISGITNKMMLTARAMHTTTILTFLTCVGVIFNHLPTTSAAPLHSSSKKTNNRNPDHGSSEVEAHDQESIASYDQRQTGQYNIKVNIKDVKIIYADREGIEGSLDDDTIYDYGDYDYDPSHLTVSPLPIFGIGSVSLTSSKPPKSSTKVPTTTVKHGTKYTTEKPQRTTIINSSPTTPNLPASTTQILPSTPVAVTVQSQPLEAQTSNGMLSTNTSSSVSEENRSTTESIGTTVKHSHNGNPVQVPQVPLTGHYDYEHIPVQVISYKRGSKMWSNI